MQRGEMDGAGSIAYRLSNSFALVSYHFRCVLDAALEPQWHSCTSQETQDGIFLPWSLSISALIRVLYLIILLRSARYSEICDVWSYL